MRYDVIPSSFAALITAIIIFVTGLSVLLKNQRRSLHKAYWLYTASLSFYFFALGIVRSINTTRWRPLPFLMALFAGVSASWFFKVFLFGKSGARLSRSYLSLSLLALLFEVYLALSTPPGWYQTAALIAVAHVLVSALSVTSAINGVIRSTTSKFVRTRLKYLSLSSLIFLTVLLITQTRILGDTPVYVGHTITVIYVYFLGQAILQQRFMDLHELLTRLGILVGIVLLISLVYFGLLFWIPRSSVEFLILNIIVGSIIVLLLLEPFERLSGEWVRFIFWRRKKLGQLVEKLSKDLQFVQDSQDSVADLVTTTLAHSKDVGRCVMLLLDDDRISLHQLPTRGTQRGPINRSTHRELLERLSYSPYLLKDEIEQELDRLKRGWALSLGVEALQAVLESMAALKADLAISVRIQNSFVGILAIEDTPVGDSFSESDVMVFRSLAKSIGSALANTDRFKKARERERLALLGKMSSGLAHEIRNPLGAIQGAAQLLMEDLDTTEESHAEFLGIITEETERLNRVVNTFLEFSRSPSVTMGTVFLPDLLGKVRAMAKTMEKDAQVLLSYEKELPPVRGQEGKLKQVLLNITLNALQSMEGDTAPLLKITVERTKRGQLVAIKDNGRGMDEETLRHIFDPFFTTREEGTGLGLAISKKIMDDHGGEIRATSAPSEGTTFWLTFPETSV